MNEEFLGNLSRCLHNYDMSLILTLGTPCVFLSALYGLTVWHSRSIPTLHRLPFYSNNFKTKRIHSQFIILIL